MAPRILLTGASGYIGSRLLRVLEEGGCAVRCLARRPERIAAGRASTEVVSGDCLDEASLLAAMDGVGQAYYLVHSMASGSGFAALDRQAAANFGRAAARAGVHRIVYLGGLGAHPYSLSTHLKSRLETGEALREPGGRGPFAVWRHVHLMEPLGPSQTLYEDRVELAAAGRGVPSRFAAAVLRAVLTLAFAHRHRIVQASVGRAKAPGRTPVGQGGAGSKLRGFPTGST